MDYTVFTNLRVTGDMKTGIAKSSITVTEDDAEEAAGSTPTKAEFNAVVALVNEMKEVINTLAEKIAD